MTHLIDVIKLGSYKDILGTYIMRNKQAIWIITKGQIKLYISPIVILRGATPLIQKSAIPKGGLIRPTSMRVFSMGITVFMYQLFSS